MSDFVVYNYPTRICQGFGVRDQLAATLHAAGARRPLLVTDRLIKMLPWFEPLLASLADFDVRVFADVWGNPVETQVIAGAAAAQAHGADAIIALGGGAPVDVAKAIALMQHHPGKLFDYEDGKPDARPVDQPIAFLVALPTTAGTGSEVGRSSVISHDISKAKKIIFDPRLLPNVVLADAELTLGLPPGVTAATGLDALTHLVEAFLARGHHPMADGIALEGVRLVAGALEVAVDFARRLDDGEALSEEEEAVHRRVRAAMLDASMMGAVAFQKGLGVIHSCAHALSTVCDTHHGLANGVMLPMGLRFNLAVAPHRFLRLARAVDPGATDGAAFIDWIVELRARLGIPAGLKSLGVKPEHLDDLVAVALADGCHPSNPRVCTEADFKALFEEAFTA